MAALRYKTAKEMEEKIDNYFESLKGQPLLDCEGQPVVCKGRIVFLEEPTPPTVCGLALHLGLKSRQSLLNYKNRSKAFEEVISRAKLRIEAYAEGRLFDRDGSRGAQFTLENNFGWKKEDASSDGEGNNLIDAIAESLKDLNKHEV